jgi:hypothetical protein
MAVVAALAMPGAASASLRTEQAVKSSAAASSGERAMAAYKVCRKVGSAYVCN